MRQLLLGLVILLVVLLLIRVLGLGDEVLSLVRAIFRVIEGLLRAVLVG